MNINMVKHTIRITFKRNPLPVRKGEKYYEEKY